MTEEQKSAIENALDQILDLLKKPGAGSINEPISPILCELVEKVVSQESGIPAGMMVVDKQQLQTLLTQKKDYETMVVNALETIVIFQGIIGNKMPTGIGDIISIVPKVMKNLSKNPEIAEQIISRLNTIQEIAPLYLPAELIAKLGQPLTVKQITA